uniref:GEN1 Holliday junction 5' flap endonuclease n=1 Tax=Sinocyclocheilus anshuiensis TaxID=1608454 RepID=A0A671SUV8_9TELE
MIEDHQQKERDAQHVSEDGQLHISHHLTAKHHRPALTQSKHLLASAMGVSELWSVLDPVRQSVPLYSLSGKTLAVDLSLWVCEAQHVQGMMGRVTKPHLRNLFFRVSSLTLMGVKLVFVMEGDAPSIKAQTMSKRSEMRYGGAKAKPTAAKNTSRSRFKAVLRECAEMLDCLGVPWVSAAGEAEAMCAYLDSQGAVDGCITNDGDVFLYGAQTVYRNFNMTTKDPQVDCYQTSRVRAELGLSRDILVGLAVLLGCDYIPKVQQIYRMKCFLK